MYVSVAILQGGHYSKITFIVRTLHITLHFLHLYILKICLKLHLCVLKILGLAMPIHMSTFHQDYIFHNLFSPGAMALLKIAYGTYVIIMHVSIRMYLSYVYIYIPIYHKDDQQVTYVSALIRSCVFNDYKYMWQT